MRAPRLTHVLAASLSLFSSLHDLVDGLVPRDAANTLVAGVAHGGRAFRVGDDLRHRRAETFGVGGCDKTRDAVDDEFQRSAGVARGDDWLSREKRIERDEAVVFVVG